MSARSGDRMGRASSIEPERARIIAALFWVINFAALAAAVLVANAYFAYWTIPPLLPLFEGDPLFVFDPEIGYVARPNSSSKWTVPSAGIRYSVHTDGRGARVAASTPAKPSRVDILFLGDSFTWGYGVEHGQTYAAKTIRNLGGDGVNLALPSYGTTQSLLTLQRHRDLAPKLAIFPITRDHLWRNVSPCARSAYPFCLDTAHVALGREGRLYIAPPWSDGVSRFMLQMRWERTGLDPLTWITHSADVTVARFRYSRADFIASDADLQRVALEYLIEHMAATAAEMKVRLLLVFIPDQSMAPTPEGLGPLAKRLGLPFLDLTAAFAELDPATRQALYIPGDGHPSAAGHALIAREITAFARGR
jgi:hypothetical protein